MLVLAERLAESRPDDAIVLIAMNLDYHPRSARSYIILSRAYTLKRDYQTAIAQLKKALEIEPENGLAKGYLYQMERR